MAENILLDKSFSFAKRIVLLTKELVEVRNERILSKQLLRSGTAIGALVREAVYAQSKADFVNKLSISLKESYETEYWIMLLKETDYINPKVAEKLIDDNKELMRILISSINTVKTKLKEKKY